MRIAVQRTAETTVQAYDLDRVASICKQLGHVVGRFAVPDVPVCDLAIMWDAVRRQDRQIRESIQLSGASVLLIGYGWLPPTETYQMSRVGVDAWVEWANKPLPSGGPHIKVKKGYLLVALQDERCFADAPISPWFRDNQQFIEFLSRHSELPIVVRLHPKDKRPAHIRAIKDVSFDESTSMTTALEGACAVACISSKAALEAMAQHLPVLCYGRAIYARRGAVYCLTDRAMSTWAITANLAAGHCDLRQDAQDAVLDELRDHQFGRLELEDRLAVEIGRLAPSKQVSQDELYRVAVGFDGDLRVRPAMEAFAAGCLIGGHKVLWWDKGPCPTCDVVVIWNGTGGYWQNMKASGCRSGARMLFMEHGWLPQATTVQIDRQGPNALSSWAEEPLTWRARGRPRKRQGDLLVICQRADDSSITLLSPHFARFADWLRFLSDHVDMPMRVRPHPRALGGETEAYEPIVSGNPLMQWDRVSDLEESMQSAAAVATINSTCGLEALRAGVPVLCYGRAIYRHDGAVVCLDNDPEKTCRAVEDLIAGRLPVDRAAMQAALNRAMEHQIPVEELPDRVCEVLAHA